MINSNIKSVRGISLVSLTIATIVLIILANVIIYRIGDGLKIENYKKMQNDIENLRDKVSSYYAQNGTIPASMKYSNIEHIKKAGVISEAVDIGDFLVIDLSAMENVTLNYGKDYEKIKSLTSLTQEEARNYTDLYIINETSQNIFYVEGITIGNETYYTDYTSNDVDTASLDLRYVEGVKIPDGFYYVEGTKNTGIMIKSNEDTQEEYVWISQTTQIKEVPDTLTIEITQTEDFIKSVNAYQGYYKSTNSNEVMYLQLDNWSPLYDKEGIYKDKNGDMAYVPEGFCVSETPGENTIDGGLVVKDSKANEWVWIEVPKSIYVTATSNTDYANIEADMQAYVSNYRNSDYTDTFYSTQQHGFANSTEYDNWKNAMLKSVYDNGGFYIGRYEAGTQTQRISDSDLTTVILKRDAYPYNFITCANAQIKTKELAPEGYSSSLMFEIQWDLVLKFIETKGAKTLSELTLDSSSWGNYANVSFPILRGKYTTSSASSWITVSGSYTKSSLTNALLTIGATDRNSTLNIYDLAGNMWEWTLGYTSDPSFPCSCRGGSWTSDSSLYPAAGYSYSSTSQNLSIFGFRPALWKME